MMWRIETSSVKRLTQRKLSTEVSQGNIKVVELYPTYFYQGVEMKANRRLHQAPSIDVDAEEDDEPEDDERHGKNLNEYKILTH